MITFKQFLLEAPWVNTEIQQQTNEDDPYDEHIESLRDDFKTLRHISTMPTGHQIWKGVDRSKSSFYYATDPNKRITSVLSGEQKNKDFHIHWAGNSKDSGISMNDIRAHLVNRHGLKLISDTEHSPGTAKNYASLIKRNDVELRVKNEKGRVLKTPVKSEWDLTKRYLEPGSRFVVTKPISTFRKVTKRYKFKSQIKEQFVDLGYGYHDHHANIEGHNVAVHFHDTGHVDFDVDGKDHLPKSNDPVQIKKNRKILLHVMGVVERFTNDKKPKKLIMQPNDDSKVSAYKTFANRIKSRFGATVNHDNEESEVNFNWRRNVKGK